MRTSTKCSTALHLLLVIAVFSPKKRVTSERLAQSAGCNPVVARNLLSSLKKAGIIHIPRGVGGATLARSPEEITLWEVYQAVGEGAPEELLGLHPNPSSQCPVGRNIHQILAGPYRQVGQAVQETMASITLARLLEEYQLLEPE